MPTSTAEGESVLLLVHNLPENLRAIFWYKGVIVFKDLEVARYVIAKNSSVPGPAHSRRETVYSNGSLLIQDVTRNDAGFYTLRTLSTDLKAEVARVQLQVDSKWFSVISQGWSRFRHTALFCLACACLPSAPCPHVGV